MLKMESGLLTMAEKEYIEREKLKQDFASDTQSIRGWDVDLFDLLMDEIDEVSAADVVPARHGHWIINSDGYYPQCSECMSEPRGREMTKYCGECGAKMDGDTNGS